jgi:mRNA-degrading endonuclease RelE of RelBE toxin-antitoxin system
MTYKVALHPVVYKSLKNLCKLDRQGYEYVKKRLELLAYKPEMGIPLESELAGKWRVHIGPYVLVYSFDKEKNILTIFVLEHYTRAYNMYTAYA